MTPVSCCVSLLIICGVVACEPAMDDELKLILDFMSVISGTWSNQEQIDRGSKEHDLIRSYVRPVQVPALPNKHLLLAETSVNNELMILAVLDVTGDNQDKNLIRMTPYDIGDLSSYQPGQFKVEELENLTRDQLKYRPDCMDQLVRVKDGVYSGICAVCMKRIPVKRPDYTVTITCEDIVSAIPLSLPARSSSVPYIMKLIGNKFKLVNPPEGYASPCDSMPGVSPNSTQA